MAGRGPRKQRRDANGTKITPARTGVSIIPKPGHVADDPVASAAFDRLVEHLASRGDLRPSYEFAISLFASEWARYVHALAVAGREPIVAGTRGPRQHPACQVAAAAARTCRDLLAEFACTSASLSRVDIPEPAAKPITTIQRFQLLKKGRVDPGDPDVTPAQAMILQHGSPEERTAMAAEIMEERELFS
jgi:phage terminase small subunit